LFQTTFSTQIMKKKLKLKLQSCYMCGAPATSREHVPPLCLFPEEKDIRTSIFRNNLITVPSCDAHNSRKSKDDEFLMASLAGIIGNNIIGFIHLQTKVKRAIERKKIDFMDSIMQERKPLNLKTSNGTEFSVLIGKADLPRLHSCFDHIAHGVFYHKFGKRFEGKTHILIDFLIYELEETETFKLLCRKRFEMEPQMLKTEGNTPDIFKYEVFDPDNIGMIAMKLTFYGYASVFVAFQPAETAEPQDLISLMVKSGLPVTVFFEDGYEFKLNKQKGES